MKRFQAKNFSSVWFQPFLFQTGSIRRVLAVPRGTLGAVDLRLRTEWEIWILGKELPMCKIGLVEPGGAREAEAWTAQNTNAPRGARAAHTLIPVRK
jgi:hypothetical protein